MRRSPIAFTLIELLVVITIIVVLLALLTPALDRAIRQAEMVVCMANIKSAMTGATLYAASSRRSYPVRPTIEKYSNTPFGWLNNANEPGSDDRVIFRDYIPLNDALNCPLNTDLDIANSKPATYTYSDYTLWFGFFYKDLPGLKRIGDRMAAVDNAHLDDQNQPLVKRYDLLVSDYSAVHRLNGYGHGTHPDSLGVWAEVVRQDATAPWGTSVAPGIATASDATLSYYQGGVNRGTVDLNFGHTDGSVSRMDEVAFAPPDEPRMDYIATFRDSTTDTGRDFQVPSASR